LDQEKQDSADTIIKRSIELIELSPKEISNRNVEWMRKKGFKIPDNTTDKFRTGSMNTRILELIRRRVF
jgi:hypothetical protein